MERDSLITPGEAQEYGIIDRVTAHAEFGSFVEASPRVDRAALGRGRYCGREYSPSVADRVGDESVEQSLRRHAELGRLLAAAAGYRVVASDGTRVGWLDHVRYERHADHPDEIVVRSRSIPPRRLRTFSYSAVEAVRPSERTVVLRADQSALARSASV
jgi:hypothetical protein